MSGLCSDGLNLDIEMGVLHDCRRIPEHPIQSAVLMCIFGSPINMFFIRFPVRSRDVEEEERESLGEG